jgi:hypothetical protein
MRETKYCQIDPTFRFSYAINIAPTILQLRDLTVFYATSQFYRNVPKF